MSLYRSLYAVLLVMSGSGLLSASVQSASSSTDASASIRASATVVNPVGMSTLAGEIEAELNAVPNENLHQKLADVLLIHTPPESLMLLILEAEGKAVSRFMLTEESFQPDRITEVGMWVPGGYLLNERAIKAVLSADDSRCVLTLIDSGN